jgi:hypothetical protein
VRQPTQPTTLPCTPVSSTVLRQSRQQGYFRISAVLPYSFDATCNFVSLETQNTKPEHKLLTATDAEFGLHTLCCPVLPLTGHDAVTLTVSLPVSSAKPCCGTGPPWDLDQILRYSETLGAGGSVVVKALCYKPEGRGFDSR